MRKDCHFPNWEMADFDFSAKLPAPTKGFCCSLVACFCCLFLPTLVPSNQPPPFFFFFSFPLFVSFFWASERKDYDEEPSKKPKHGADHPPPAPSTVPSLHNNPVRFGGPESTSAICSSFKILTHSSHSVASCLFCCFACCFFVSSFCLLGCIFVLVVCLFVLVVCFGCLVVWLVG